jgi:hypothetical protein
MAFLWNWCIKFRNEKKVDFNRFKQQLSER